MRCPLPLNLPPQHPQAPGSLLPRAPSTPLRPLFTHWPVSARGQDCGDPGCLSGRSPQPQTGPATEGHRQILSTQHPGSPSGARAPVLTSPLQPRKPQSGPRRGSPELPAQFLEEKANGEEAQGGRRGEDAGPVVPQVPPQAAGEGLQGEGAGGRAAARRDTAAARRMRRTPPEWEEKPWGSIICGTAMSGSCPGTPAQLEARTLHEIPGPRPATPRNLELGVPGGVLNHWDLDHTCVRGCVHSHSALPQPPPPREVCVEGSGTKVRSPTSHVPHPTRRALPSPSVPY